MEEVMIERGSEKHAVSEGRLLAFIYETLDEEEKRAVEKHLMTCLRCQIISKKLRELKESMENEPKPATNETWQKVRDLSREIGREDRDGEFEVPGGLFRKFRTVFSRGFVLPVGIAAALLLVFGFMTLREQISVERIYFLKATEGVTVNGKSFFDRARKDYPVNRKLDMGVQDGECVFQLGNNSLMIAEKNTVFSIEDGKVLTIRLVKGSVIAKVHRLPGTKEIRVVTPMGSFAVSSAVFYIRNEANYVECGVKEGELRSVIGDRTSVINEMARIKIDSNGKEYLARLDPKKGGFGKLDDYYLN
jgi:hypothetical protein